MCFKYVKVKQGFRFITLFNDLRSVLECETGLDETNDAISFYFRFFGLFLCLPA